MANDWKPWTGKKLPKRNEDTVVWVKWGHGSESRYPYRAGALNWQWSGEPDPFSIVAYRRASDGE